MIIIKLIFAIIAGIVTYFAGNYINDNYGHNSWNEISCVTGMTMLFIISLILG